MRHKLGLSNIRSVADGRCKGRTLCAPWLSDFDPLAPERIDSVHRIDSPKKEAGVQTVRTVGSIEAPLSRLLGVWRLLLLQPFPLEYSSKKGSASAAGRVVGPLIGTLGQAPRQEEPKQEHARQMGGSQMIGTLDHHQAPRQEQPKQEHARNMPARWVASTQL